MSLSKHLTACLILALLPGAVHSGQWQEFSGFADIARLATASHFFSGGPGVDGIPSMTDPDFVAADDADFVLDNELVMGVYLHGVARAYPEALGWHHEVINDVIGGQGVAVTLCPLTGTGLVFDATDDDGRRFELGVSGGLINSNLVMYDRRDNETLWPQMIYTAIRGSYAGEELQLLPVVETTWAMWRRMHPDTQVAVPGTGLDSYPASRRDAFADLDRYLRYPYGGYRTSDGIAFPLTTGTPDFDRLHPKAVVLGICRDGAAKSYPFDRMPDGAVINDELGSERIVVVFDTGSGTAIPYSSRVDGRDLTFYAVEPAAGELPVAFRDVETGTRWDMLGRAATGSELEGHRLEQVPAHNAMWFAWDTYWHEAPVWAGEGIIDEPPETAVAEQIGGRLPGRTILGQNYPNPFNPTTHIQLRLQRRSAVSVRVYDILGQAVSTLLQGDYDGGQYLLSWDGRNDAGEPVASGSYLYHLEAPGVSETKSMILAR